jgi:hypothetical protein
MYRGQNTRQSHNIKAANKSFERVEQFEYFGKTVTIRIPFREKSKAD